jgi:hypothetical protein
MRLFASDHEPLVLGLFKQIGEAVCSLGQRRLGMVLIAAQLVQALLNLVLGR